MNSIYKKLEKIDDIKSLNEKWNVKNQTELKKLIKESIDGADDAIEAAREYILDQYSWNDYDYNETDTEFSMTVWCGGEYYDDDESETKYVMSIQKLVDLMNNRGAFEQYIDECSNYTDYESLGNDFYRRAEEELNKHFNCTGAFLEPSTQLGQGRTFLFADNMTFEGSFDFQTGEEYIRDNDFEGFLELCKNSFSKRVTESYSDDEDEEDDYDEYDDDGDFFGSQEQWNWDGLKDDIDCNMSDVKINGKKLYEYETTVVNDEYIHIVVFIENDDGKTLTRYETDLDDMYAVPEYSSGVVEYVENLDWKQIGVEPIDVD